MTTMRSALPTAAVLAMMLTAAASGTSKASPAEQDGETEFSASTLMQDAIVLPHCLDLLIRDLDQVVALRPVKFWECIETLGTLWAARPELREVTWQVAKRTGFDPRMAHMLSFVANDLGASAGPTLEGALKELRPYQWRLVARCSAHRIDLGSRNRHMPTSGGPVHQGLFEHLGIERDWQTRIHSLKERLESLDATLRLTGLTPEHRVALSTSIARGLARDAVLADGHAAVWVPELPDTRPDGFRIDWIASAHGGRPWIIVCGVPSAGSQCNAIKEDQVLNVGWIAQQWRDLISVCTEEDLCALASLGIDDKFLQYGRDVSAYDALEFERTLVVAATSARTRREARMPLRLMPPTDRDSRDDLSAYLQAERERGRERDEERRERELARSIAYWMYETRESGSPQGGTTDWRRPNMRHQRIPPHRAARGRGGLLGGAFAAVAALLFGIGTSIGWIRRRFGPPPTSPTESADAAATRPLPKGPQELPIQK